MLPLTSAPIRFEKQVILDELLVCLDIFIFFGTWFFDFRLAFGCALHAEAKDFSVIRIDGNDKYLPIVQNLSL